MERLDISEATRKKDKSNMAEAWFQRSVESKLQRLRIRSLLGRQFLAEFFGTFILVIFGNGSVAQSVLSNGNRGEFLSIDWGFGVGLLLGVYFSAGISGGHLNPAVSLAMATLGKMPWRALPVYAAAQFCGAFFASVIIYGVYADAINAFDGGERMVSGPTGTAGIWGTYPQEFLTLQEGFLDQIVGTALLVACILAITDKKNCKPVGGMEPFIVGLALFGIGLAYGFNCGFAVNPARDFAPRLFTAIAQYGSDVWTPNGKHWWWVPILGPFIGGLIGGWFYYLLIELHHPPEDEDTAEELDQINGHAKDGPVAADETTPA
ncbi:aquaporin-3-like isoform X2 [Amphiura filiformis]|uniref:aquaporin-3-like isoform X2 n=1 Tax=Amphiura filiformis TaxID=82378 RepID=UPI003B2257D7